ncbi:hypothetical protein BKA62DRAFT_770485 [Auriculariales sp. MPI-PUGE-AT-0066]|nr:hypothetical protein BKA62DRAFT_770485 [Auriculariales sp. MPI-PUGE-AT-0066]
MQRSLLEQFTVPLVTSEDACTSARRYSINCMRQKHNYRTGLYSLPLELLAQICIFYVDAEDASCSQDRPLRLCHISQLLRQVALSTAALWSQLQFRLNNATSGFLVDAMHADLSGSHNLNVEIDWTTCHEGLRSDEVGDWDVFPATAGHVDNVARILLPHMHRVRTFYFTCQVYEPIHRLFIALENTPAPRLQRLELIRPIEYSDQDLRAHPNRCRKTPRLFGNYLPALRFAHFEGIYFQWKHVKLANLQVLVLRDFPRSMQPSFRWFGKTLSASSAIEHIEIDHGVLPADEEEVNQFPVCVLPCLQRVNIARYDAAFFKVLSQVLDIPNLDVLDITQVSMEALDAALTAFHSLRRGGAAHNLLQNIMNIDHSLVSTWDTPGPSKQHLSAPMSMALPHLRDLCLFRGLEADIGLVRNFLRHRSALGVPLEIIEYCEFAEAGDEFDSSYDTALITLDGLSGCELAREAIQLEEDETAWNTSLIGDAIHAAALGIDLADDGGILRDPEEGMDVVRGWEDEGGTNVGEEGVDTIFPFSTERFKILRGGHLARAPSFPLENIHTYLETRDNCPGEPAPLDSPSLSPTACSPRLSFSSVFTSPSRPISSISDYDLHELTAYAVPAALLIADVSTTLSPHYLPFLNTAQPGYVGYVAPS